MQIKGDIKFADLIALQKNYLYTAQKMKIFQRNLRIGMISVLSIFLFFFYEPSIHPLIIAFKIILIMFVVAIIPVILELVVIWKLKRSNYLEQLGPFELDMSETGIHFRRKGSSREFSWQNIEQIILDDEYIFIYVDQQSVIVLPENTVQTSEEIVSFLSPYFTCEKIVQKPPMKVKQKTVFISLVVAFVAVFSVQHMFYGKNSVNYASQKVRDLYVAESADELKQGESSKIKDSVTQEQIDEAIEVVQNIESKNDSHHEMIVMSLQASLLIAQNQLNHREEKEEEKEQ